MDYCRNPKQKRPAGLKNLGNVEAGQNSPVQPQDEYLDLVDPDDKVIGRKKRSEIYAEHNTNFRVVNLFIVNSKGEIWFPRRTEHKRIFPLCLDMSMGGACRIRRNIRNGAPPRTA